MPVAYVIGTFPTAQIIGWFVGHDPTAEGSKNPGASNMFRVAGRWAGVVVLLGDVCKAAIPALIGLWLGGRPLAAAAGAAAMLGHVFPMKRGFRGGRGVATFGATCLVLWPIVSLSALALWAVLVRVTGRASVGSLIGSLTIVAGVAVTGRPGWEIAVAATMAAVVILRHRENVARLLRREETSIHKGS